jgi:tetratricopeptide (TPR) repeat protein
MPIPTRPKPPITPTKMLTYRHALENYVNGPPGNNDCDGWANLASAYASDYLNRWNEAEFDLRQADDLLVKAQSAVTQAYHVNKACLGAHYAQGLIYRAGGKHQLALNEFSAAYNGSRTVAAYAAQYYNELINVGQPDQAISYLASRVGTTNYDDGIFYWILGRAYFFREVPDYLNAAKFINISRYHAPNRKYRHFLWYVWAYLISAYSLNNNPLAKQELNVRDATGGTPFIVQPQYPHTITEVVHYETQIQYDHNPVMIAGISQFHSGLTRAGMPP